MATLKELTYNVLNIARGGLSSDDDRLNERQIAFWIGYYRARKIYEESRGGRSIDPQLLQDLGCLELKKVDKANCPEVLWGCGVKRVAIPKVVDLPKNRGIAWIGLVDKQEPIILSSPDVLYFRDKQRFTGNMRKAYFIGGYLYVTDALNEDIKWINVRGVFDDPLAIETKDADGNGQCITWEDEYPMPEHYISDIVQRIMQYELNMSIRAVNDEVNDSRETDTAGTR